ncbi:MAG TPA: SDR family oxidoreductase [Candidatus Acidoferrum sp.]|nr:SDR family oxidoreductase [Candidatus Acidoferrum sp.]
MAEPTSPKTALVTGAGKRIGRAIALDLARHGWAVAVHYRHSALEAADVVQEIEQAGGRAVALQADLAREADTHALIARAAEALGPLTCLVNSASLFEMDKIETVTRASWDAHIETNLRAPLVLSQGFAAQLPAGMQGNIVNMLDQRVWNLTPYFLSYTVAKTGLWTLTQTLALALAPRIRVNGIGPGPTLPSPRQSPEQFAEQWRAMPLGRGTTPEEICAALRFIVSAPAMTGQMIALDGGQHLGWAQPSRGYVARE